MWVRPGARRPESHRSHAIVAALLATAKISARTAGGEAALRGVSPRGMAWAGRSGPQRYRIDDALQVCEPEGLVEEWCRAFPLPLTGSKFAAG